MTLQKSLNRRNLQTGSDVIKKKNYMSSLLYVLSDLKVSSKSGLPFPRNRVHKIGKKKNNNNNKKKKKKKKKKKNSGKETEE